MGCIISGDISTLSEVAGTASPYHTDYEASARTIFLGVELDLTFYWERDFLLRTTDPVLVPETYTQSLIKRTIASGEIWPFQKVGVNISTVQVWVYNSDTETSTPLVLNTDYEVSDSYITFLNEINLTVVEELRMSYDFEGDQGGLFLDQEYKVDGSLLFLGTNIGRKSLNIYIPRVVMTLDQNITMIDDGSFATSAKSGKIDFEPSINSYFKIYGSEAIK